MRTFSVLQYNKDTRVSITATGHYLETYSSRANEPTEVYRSLFQQELHGPGRRTVK